MVNPVGWDEMHQRVHDVGHQPDGALMHYSTCWCRRTLTPTGWDEHRARIEVRSIIDSYTLTMVGHGAEEYVEACADDVIHALLGWPVTYKASS